MYIIYKSKFELLSTIKATEISIKTLAVINMYAI